jgi:hypothetical protein
MNFSHTNTVNIKSSRSWLFAQDFEKWISAFYTGLKALDLFAHDFLTCMIIEPAGTSQGVPASSLR